MTATAWADQLSESGVGLRTRPIDNYGKLRVVYFHYKNLTGGTLPDGTEIDIGWLPPGVMRIFPLLSAYRTVVAGGASRVLNIGRRAYASKYNPNPSALEVEEAAGFVSAKDISAAVVSAVFDAGNNMAIDFSSRKGILAYASVTGGTIPSLWELEGYFTLVTE